MFLGCVRAARSVVLRRPSANLYAWQRGLAAASGGGAGTSDGDGDAEGNPPATKQPESASSTTPQQQQKKPLNFSFTDSGPSSGRADDDPLSALTELGKDADSGSSESSFSFLLNVQRSDGYSANPGSALSGDDAGSKGQDGKYVAIGNSSYFSGDGVPPVQTSEDEEDMEDFSADLHMSSPMRLELALRADAGTVLPDFDPDSDSNERAHFRFSESRSRLDDDAFRSDSGDAYVRRLRAAAARVREARGGGAGTSDAEIAAAARAALLRRSSLREEDIDEDENAEPARPSRFDRANLLAELRRLQRRGAVPPPPLVQRPAPPDAPAEPGDDRLVSPEMFDFTRSRPTQLAPGEVTPWIHKCPGHRQGKSGFSGRCEIFNQWDLHFQNVVLLKRFSSASAMIMPRRRTGLCARCQRKVARTVKRARHMGAIPYIGTYNVKVDTSATQPQARQTWGQQQSSTAAPVGSRFKSLSWDAERGLQ